MWTYPGPLWSLSGHGQDTQVGGCCWGRWTVSGSPRSDSYSYYTTTRIVQWCGSSPGCVLYAAKFRAALLSGGADQLKQHPPRPSTSSSSSSLPSSSSHYHAFTATTSDENDDVPHLHMIIIALTIGAVARVLQYFCSRRGSQSTVQVHVVIGDPLVI